MKNKMPNEIRFKCPSNFKGSVDKLKEFFPEMSLDNIYFIIFEYGFNRVQEELIKGDKIAKVEYLPSQSIKKLVFVGKTR